MSAVVVPINQLSARQCEGMLRTLMAVIPEPVSLATFLDQEAASANRQQSELAQELIRYAVQRRFLIQKG